MNQDLRQRITLGVTLASAGVCAAWFFIVRPETAHAHELANTFEANQRMVARYDEQRNTAAELSEEEGDARFRRAVGILHDASVSDEEPVDLHNLVNRLADEQGITVTRIETVSDRVIRERIDTEAPEAEAIEQMVRVELEGSYEDTVLFLGRVQESKPIVRCVSFRMLPIDVDVVRTSVEVQMFALTVVPGIDLEPVGG